jgi:molybdopterin converting factor subunit 1
MQVTVLLFAQARDRAGTGRVVLDLEPGSRVRDLVVRMNDRHPGLDALGAHLAIAVDGELVERDAPLADGAEVAMLPPVSGG